MRKRLLTTGFLAFTVLPVFVPAVALFAQPTREERANNPNPPEPPMQQPVPNYPPPPPGQSAYCGPGVSFPGLCN